MIVRILLATLPLVLLFSSCDKNDPIERADPVIPTVPTIPPPPPPPVSDTLGTLKTSWKIAKDSVTNIGNYYFMDGSSALTPIPGVYWGVAADYWNFLATGILSVRENGMNYNVSYNFPDKTTLTTNATGPVKKGKLIGLTASSASFEWKDTSANGGLYYRRIYLYK